MSPSLTRADRWGAACGALSVLGTGVGNQLAGAPGSAGEAVSSADVLAWFRAPTTTATAVGMTLEIVGMLCLPVFLAWWSTTLRRRARPGSAVEWLAGLTVLAGGVALAVKLASFMPMAAAFGDAGTLDATIAKLLLDMDAGAFVVVFLPTALMLLAAGSAILLSGVLGRVAGWSAVVIGALLLVSTLATRVDPRDTNPMPYLAGLLWLLVVSVRLTWRGPRPVVAGTAPIPVSIPL